MKSVLVLLLTNFFVSYAKNVNSISLPLTKTPINLGLSSVSNSGSYADNIT